MIFFDGNLSKFVPFLRPGTVCHNPFLIWYMIWNCWEHSKFAFILSRKNSLMASPSLMPAASMSSTVRSSLLHPFCGKGTYRSTLCAHVDSKSVCTPYPSTVWMQLHFSSWLIRLIQVYLMQRQAWLSGQVKIRWKCLVVVTFILCMQACHSRQASDKPPALGVKFNISKGFMRCILDIIFFISGIFLM